MKKIFALGLALALSLGLAACGGGSGDSSAAPAAPAAPVVDEAAAAFIGTWEYAEYNGGYIIYEDGSCDIVWQDTDTDYGTWELQEDSVTVSNSGGEWYADLSFGSDGSLIDDQGDALNSVSDFTFLGTAAAAAPAAAGTAAVSGDSAGFVGTWEYNDYNGGYMLYEDGSAYIIWEGDGAAEATWELGSDCATVYNADGEWYADLSFAADGSLMDDSGDYLTAVSDLSFDY